MSGAWDMILFDRPKAAVTLSRWVVEASLICIGQWQGRRRRKTRLMIASKLSVEKP